MKTTEPSERGSRLFAQTLQKALTGDPDHAALAASLGKDTFQLTLTEWAVSVVFVPQESGVAIQSIHAFSGTPTVSASGKVADFVGLFTRASSSVIRANIRIEGDVRVLARYQDFFSQWRLDIGHVLASTFGEGPARFLHAPLRWLADGLKTQREERLQDLKEILYEEKRYLVPKAELETFYADLKELQLRVDRLDARARRSQ